MNDANTHLLGKKPTFVYLPVMLNSLRRARPAAAVIIAVATALVVIVEGAFSGQLRLLSGIYPDPALPGVDVAAAPPGTVGGRVAAGTGRMATGPDSGPLAT